jgi:uridine kinase
MNPFVIGIAGASGSGKSTLASDLLATLNRAEPDRAVALPLDAYYRDLSHLSFEQRDRMNFDHPDALELELVGAHLKALRSGSSVEVPVYDFSTHTRTTEFQSLPAADVVIVEGILALADPVLAALYDLTVFVDAPLDLCLARRIVRDQQERGRDEDSVKTFWFERVLPMFEAFVMPAKSLADVTVDGTAAASEGVGLILGQLNATRAD